MDMPSINRPISTDISRTGNTNDTQKVSKHHGHHKHNQQQGADAVSSATRSTKYSKTNGVDSFQISKDAEKALDGVKTNPSYAQTYSRNTVRPQNIDSSDE